MRRVTIFLLVMVIGAAAGVLGVVAGHKSDRQRVVEACHAALLKASPGTFSGEQVATPAKSAYVVTGLLVKDGAGSQWTCEATVSGGQVVLQRAELR